MAATAAAEAANSLVLNDLLALQDHRGITAGGWSVLVCSMHRLKQRAIQHERTMAKGTRITLTKPQVESPTGRRLVDLILSTCHDGVIDSHEIVTLHEFLCQPESNIAAIGYLRSFTREMLADGTLDGAEAFRLKQAFQRVVPKNVRSIVATHLEALGLPSAAGGDGEPAWFQDKATARQLAYIHDLGGEAPEGLTKGEASGLIDQLLERRPPTARQTMLCRFFDRVDLIGTCKDTVSDWLDDLFTTNPTYELAWQRFKTDALDGAPGDGAERVPIGAYRRYVVARSSGREVTAQKPGCGMVIVFALLIGLSIARVV